MSIDTLHVFIASFCVITNYLKSMLINEKLVVYVSVFLSQINIKYQISLRFRHVTSDIFALHYLLRINKVQQAVAKEHRD